MSQAQTLFSNVRADPLHFYEGNSFRPRAVVDFLKLKNDEVAKATGVSKSSVRYDGAIPKVLSDRLEQIASVCSLVAQHLDGDAQKTARWFQLPNVLLGGFSPRDMIRIGKYQKLMSVIESAITGEGP